MTNDYHDRTRVTYDRISGKHDHPRLWYDRNAGQGPTEYLPSLAQMPPAL